MQTIYQFNSKEVARIFGVNVSTVKRWTESKQLDCIKTNGGHRIFLPEHLSAFVNDNKKFQGKTVFWGVRNDADLQQLYHIFKQDFDHLAEIVYSYLKEGDSARIHEILKGLYLSQVPLYRIYDDLLTPVLHRIGDEWQAGQLPVTREHLYAQTVRDAIIRLQGIVRIPAKKNDRTALLVNIDDELHDIALKMVHHLLELKGYTVLFSGQITPGEDLLAIIRTLKVTDLFISVSCLPGGKEKNERLQETLNQLDRSGPNVYLGGRALAELDLHGLKRTKILTGMKAVADL